MEQSKIKDTLETYQRASRLVPGVAQATHHYNVGTHDAEASPSSMSKEPIVIDISDNEE